MCIIPRTQIGMLEGGAFEAEDARGNLLVLERWIQVSERRHPRIREDHMP